MKILVTDSKRSLLSYVYNDILLSEKIVWGRSRHRWFYTFWAGFAFGLLPLQMLVTIFLVSIMAPLAITYEVLSLGRRRAKNLLPIMLGSFELVERKVGTNG